MSRRSPRYGLALPILLLCFAVACSDTDSSVTATTAPTSFSVAHSITAEPATLLPEVLPGLVCTPYPPFGTRIIVVLNGGVTTLPALRFRFTDRFGVTALPRVTPIPGSSPLTTPLGSIPTTSPVPPLGVPPLPSPPTVPFPGDGSPASLPYLLTFECGVFPEGTLVVGVDLGGRTSELRLRVGL